MSRYHLVAENTGLFGLPAMQLSLLSDTEIDAGSPQKSPQCFEPFRARTSSILKHRHRYTGAPAGPWGVTCLHCVTGRGYSGQSARNSAQGRHGNGRRKRFPQDISLLKLSRNSVHEHLAGRVIDQVKAEEFGAFAQGVELTGSIELIVSGCAGVFIEEVAGQNPVDQDRELTGGGGVGLGFAGRCGQAAVEGPERGRSARFVGAGTDKRRSSA